MRPIMPDILSLDQYQEAQKNPKSFRPSVCPYCGKAGLHCHGCYYRKADRSNTLARILVMIFRFLCTCCNRTCSVLPEYIPPRRWYLWNDFQQIAIAFVLAGKSLAATAKAIIPSRHTVSRWINRLKNQFQYHKDTLCTHVIDLGRTIGFDDFWPACFTQMPLSKAMLLCNVAGVNIP